MRERSVLECTQAFATLPMPAVMLRKLPSCRPWADVWLQCTSVDGLVRVSVRWAVSRRDTRQDKNMVRYEGRGMTISREVRKGIGEVWAVLLK